VLSGLQVPEWQELAVQPSEVAKYAGAHRHSFLRCNPKKKPQRHAAPTSQERGGRGGGGGYAWPLHSPRAKSKSKARS
jgi:hypothetical protein